MENQHHKGFTIIELMVTIAVTGILLAVASPSFTAWIHNERVRTAAESIQNGLNLARAEAVQRNRDIGFELKSSGTALWVVGEVPSPLPAAPAAIPVSNFSHSGVRAEGSSGSVLITPAAGVIVFNGMGRLRANTTLSKTMSFSVANGVLAAGQVRELNLILGDGGQIRLCDKSVTRADDPRKCP